MLPDHRAAAFGFMLTSTVSPLVFDDGSSTYPHSAAPHCSIRTDPLFPSVCQSPSGISVGSSFASCEIFKTCGAAAGVGGAASAGVSIGAVIGWILGD